MSIPAITIREAVLDGRRLTGNAMWKDNRGEWRSLRVIGHDRDGNPCRSYVFAQDRPDLMSHPREPEHINAEVWAEWDKLPQVILGR